MGFWFTFLWWLATSVIETMLAPKPKDASASSLGDFNVPTAEEGRPLPLVYGTCKVAGPNVTWWGDLKIEPIKEESDGFFGIGGQSVVVGYKYYLGMQMCLCSDVIDALVDVVIGEKSLTAQGASVYCERGYYHPYQHQFTVSKTSMFGGDKQEGGIEGTVDVYFGTSSQGSNDYLSTQWGRTASAFRGCTYIVLRQVYIGTSNYPKNWAPILRRCPAGVGYGSANINGDANPSAIIYDLLTLPPYKGGLGIASSRIDTDSFAAAKQTLSDENFGMSILIDTAKSADEWLAEICRHIDGVLFTDPMTGKWTLKLIRNDYVTSNLITLDETNIETPKVKRPSWNETLNNIVVRYCDRSAGFVTKVVQTRDLANRAIRGIDELSVLDFFGISNATLAQKICERERRTHAYPLAGVTIEANRMAYSLRIGSPFKLHWPDLGFNNKVMRVTAIKYGSMSNGNMRIEIEAIEDVFTALPNSTISQPPTNLWVNPVTAPTPIVYGKIVSAPYWLVGESYNAIAMAERTDRQTTAIDVWVAEGTEYQSPWRKATSMSSSTPTATLHSILTTDSYPTVDIIVDAGFDLDRVYDASGGNANETWAGKHLCVIDNEWLAFTNVVKNPDNTWTIQGAMRGMLDSVPEIHTSGTRVWFPTSGCCLTSVTDSTGTGGSASGGSGSIPAHTHSESDVTNLTTDLAGKAPTSHTHSESDVTGLTTDLAAKLSDAPSDGKSYARKNAAWSEVTSGGGGGISDAPSDGKTYGRKDAAWTEVTGGSGGTGGVAWTFWDPDYIASTSTTQDDYFDGTSLDSKWTTINWSLLSTKTVDSGRLKLAVTSSQSRNMMGVMQPLPAGDFAIVGKISAFYATADAVCGLALSDGVTVGSGSQIHIFWSKADNVVYVYTWSGFTSLGSSVAAVASSTCPKYFKIVRSGTVCTFFFSMDGEQWTQVGGNVTPSFTPAYMGLLTSCNSGVFAQNIDYFMYRASATAAFGGLRTVGSTSYSDGLCYFDPCKPPENPSAQDDEFSTSTIDASWAQILFGSTTMDANGTKVGSLVIKAPAANGDNCNAVVKSIPTPSGDWTAWTVIDIANSGSTAFGGFITSTANTKSGSQTQFCVGYEGGFAWQVEHTGGSFAGFGGSVIGNTPVIAIGKVFLRLRKSGSNFYFAMSANGETWMESNAITLGYVPSYIGLMFKQVNGPYASTAAFDFFRFSSSDGSGALKLGGSRVVGYTLPDSRKYVPQISENFTTLDRFTQVSGTWSVASNELTQSDPSASSRFLRHNIPVYLDEGGVFEVDIKMPAAPSGDARAGFSLTDANSTSNGALDMCLHCASTTTKVAAINNDVSWYFDQDCTYGLNTWVTLRVIRRNGYYRFYVNGVLAKATSFTSNSWNPTYVNLWTYGTAASFRNMRVWNVPELEISYQGVMDQSTSDFVHGSTEVATNEMWRGKRVFMKTVDFGNLPNNTTKSVAHGITSPFRVYQSWGSCQDASGNTMTFPDKDRSMWFNSTNIVVQTTYDRSNESADITIKYIYI